MAIAATLLLAAHAEAVDYVPGIDVSHWQGNINWTSVRNAGIEFAFVKATEGVDYVDPMYQANMQGAKSAGVLVGPYHFCRVESKNGVPFTSYDGRPFAPGSDPYVDAVSEASDFLDAILPYYQTGWHLPPVADVESLPDFNNTSLERTFISNWVQLFSNTIHDKLGVRPLIYTSKSRANTYYTPSVAAGHDLWIAWWKGTGTTSPPLESDTPRWNPWVFWQWTDASTVAGISGNVDADVFRGTTQDLTQLLVTHIPGDFDHNLTVDAADYTVWRNGLGSSHTMADYNLWKTHFGRTAGAGATAGLPSSATAAVPEPTCLALLVVGLATMIRWCARRTSCCILPRKEPSALSAFAEFCRAAIGWPAQNSARLAVFPVLSDRSPRPRRASRRK